MCLGAQQGQCFLAGSNRADLQAPGTALLLEYLATGFVVVHHQQACTLQWAIEIGGGLLEALGIQWQGQPQGAALSVAALNTELAIHQAHQLARNDQTQAPAQFAGTEEVGAMQLGVEQGITFAGFQRTTAVLHGDAQTR